ncbi:MAG: alpha/beta fold hydrolase [Opitutales bacterium]|nr:alpha/beta fold hydrolase [Opitutales bacterium]
MNIIWLNGWGLSSRYVERIAVSLYPNLHHTVILPAPNWIELLAKQNFDSILVGYSLGAFLLLSRPDLATRFSQTILLAPFEDFRAEAGRGGRIRKAQLAYLLRWLGRNRVEALGDFWSRAELKDPAYPKELTTCDLEWGIQRLLKSSACGWPVLRLKSYVGDQDRLLDAGDLKNRSRYLNVVAGAGHDLLPLAKAAKLAE